MLLTIAIPTWNRNAQLELTVAELVRQLRPDVSILVVDNCSDIPISETLAAEYKARVQIVTNRLNIGGPANVLRCFELADSKWVWIFGDDDAPAADAIDRVLKAISENPDCCLLDFGHFLSLPRTKDIRTSNCKDAIEVMYYRDRQPVALVWSDGHISNEILNREMLRSKVRLGYKYVYTWYSHVAMVFSAISDDRPCLFSGPQLALPRKHGESVSEYVQADIAKGWRQIAEIFSDEAVRRRFLEAIKASSCYGDHLFDRQPPPESIGRKVYRSLMPKSVRRIISACRHRMNVG